MKNKDVLFVKQLATIPPSYGGVSVYVKRLVFSLLKKGFLAGAFSHCNPPVGIPETYLNFIDVHQPKHFNSYKALICFPQILKSFSNCSIIHNHCGINISFSLLILHKINGIPIVFTIHNQMLDREFDNLNIIDRICFKQLAKDYNVQIIAVSENGKKILEEKPILYANPIQVIPAYIPPVEIGEPQDYLANSLIEFLKGRKKIMLFYAESFATYNENDIYGTLTIIDLFIRIKSEVNDLSLIFCLANENLHIEKLDVVKRRIDDIGYNNDVYWQIGAISEMWPLLKSCQLYVRPTCTDGDSVLIREALAYGLPVVASDITERPEGCIVYHYDDMNDLYGKTLYALNMKDRKVYPQIDYSEEVLSIYKHLLNK